MLFMESPYEQMLEKSMMSVPNFRPRGQGVIVLNRFEYSAEMCDCRNCTEKVGKRCRHTVCNYFTERIHAGVVPFSELIKTALSEVKNNAFRIRLSKYMNKNEGKWMLYRGDDHKQLFEKAVTARNNNSAAFISALYLLTADSWLWSKAKQYVSKTAVEFSGIRLSDCSVEAYTLFMAAKDLYGAERHMHITVSDLADKSIIEDKIFTVICNAMAFRRYGINALKIAEKEGGRQ